MEPVSREEYENITTSTNSMLDNVDSQVVVTFVVIAVGIIVLAVLGNVLEIIVVCRSSQMRSLSDMFVLNLACCHLLQATFCMPVSLYNLSKTWDWQSLQMLCFLWVMSVAISVQVSAFSLCLIILDIYFDIVHQKWYRNWLNTPKVVLALCTVWGIPLAVNTWPLTPSKGSQLFDMENNQCSIQASPWLVYSSATFYFLLPGVCVTVLYLSVFCYFRKRLQACKVTRIDYADFCRIFDPFEYRTLVVIGIQVFAFVVLWTPFWVYMCLYTSKSITPNYFTRKIAIWICYLTTLVSPMLHIFGNWKFQLVLKRLFAWRRVTRNGRSASRRLFTFAGSFRKVYPRAPPFTTVMLVDPYIRQNDEVNPV
ncbi:alpha-1B adrenergic receptor-like [Pomacea canaliculata]|uniref:alpha-1B adrenergic receptor-like n=1 Tax=Pomacea canaliculata TaxID=400727 RepID=UPI000D72C493|nr:alpha-1B adrenergic receptor-like [Pomacea canaliculata]